MSLEGFYIFMINHLKLLAPQSAGRGPLSLLQTEIVARQGESPPLCPPLALAYSVCGFRASGGQLRALVRALSAQAGDSLLQL